MNTGTDKRRPLGRGLAALLPPKPAEPPPASAPSAATEPGGHMTVAIDEIAHNPAQPRTMFQAEPLEELAASIRVNGILQPLIVRRTTQGYQIVAGERRWRAAKLAGLKEVPVIVQEVSDPQMLELALIENIQREDLNPMELAHAYDRLGRELGLSHQEIGRRTGKDRSSIANSVRLLSLPKDVQILVGEQRISMGHARAILGLSSAEQQIELAKKTASQGLSVRQVEVRVQEAIRYKNRDNLKPEPPTDPNVRHVVQNLEHALGTRVRIVQLSEKRGRIEIDFFSQEELDRLYTLLVGGQ